MSATGRRHIAVERGVGIEHLEIVHRAVLETRVFRRGVMLRRAEEDLAKAKIDAAGEVRDHAAHVMGDDLEIGKLVEQPRIDQARHARRSLIGPAEAEPDLGLGRLLAGIVRKIRAAHRMHPDRQIVRRHALENRTELGCRERLAGDIGKDLDAARTEAGHGTIDLGKRSLDIVHGKRCDERRESIGVPAAEIRQRVVCQPRKLGSLVGWGNELERRIGKREHLLQPVELVEQGKPCTDVPQSLQAGKRGQRHMAGDNGAEAIEIRLRHEMIEDVDHNVQPAPGKRGRPYCVKRYCTMTLAANSSSSFISRGVNPCSKEYCAIVSITWRLALIPWFTMGVARAFRACAGSKPISRWYSTCSMRCRSARSLAWLNAFKILVSAQGCCSASSRLITMPWLMG